MGNSGKTFKGGNGMAFYYLRNINKEDLGQGSFGYSSTFDGLGVFLNTILQKKKNKETYNYI